MSSGTRSRSLSARSATALRDNDPFRSACASRGVLRRSAFPCLNRSARELEASVIGRSPVKDAHYMILLDCNKTTNLAPRSAAKALLTSSRVLPPALLHRLIVLAGARTYSARLRVPIALEKEAEAVVAPPVAARIGEIDAGPARHEAALGLVVQYRDEFGAIVGLAA